MKRGCPNSECSFHTQSNFVRKDGTYFRKNDSRIIKRFRCTKCGKRFSSSTFDLAKNQKKRRVNTPLAKLLSSGLSMRRAAIFLQIHRKTVKRKLEFLAKKARLEQEKFLASLKENPLMEMQLDDLITFEHSKLKPLSITVAINPKTREILSAKVSRIPAFGRLAAKARKKYGPRKSGHLDALKEVISKVAPTLNKKALITTDEHSAYPKSIKSFLPEVRHQRYKGKKGAVVGQGELKKVGFDPLFSINHTLAMLRANMNRLFRRTWCTTKTPESLQNHLDVYIRYHNTHL